MVAHKIKNFLLHHLNRILSTFDLEIHKINSRAQRTNLSEALDHIASLKFYPRTIIDVGVAHGTWELYEKFPDAFHLLIEPLEEYKVHLKLIVKKFKAEYILAAAGATVGTTIINVHPDLVGSSILKENENSDVNGIPREVPKITVDEACAAKNLTGPYLLKIDVQGTELDVLDGSATILKAAEVIILEVSLFKFFDKGHEFSDVISYMKTRGFVVYDLFGGHNRLLDNAMAQTDIIFVKEKGMFQKYQFYATQQQREKLTKQLKR